MKRTFLFSLCILFMALVSGCGNEYGTKLSFGAGELFYKNEVTKADAEKLGNYLLAEGFFDERAPRSVQLLFHEGSYIFRMVTNEELQQDPDLARTMRFVSMDMAADVFEGANVDIELTDDLFNTIKTIPSPGARVDRGTVRIYRMNEVDETQSNQVTDYLLQIGFIGEKPMSICYGIEGDDFLYELVTQENAEFDNEIVQANKTIAGLISVTVLANKPVKMNFLDESFAVKSTYPYEEIRNAYLNFVASDSLAQE